MENFNEMLGNSKVAISSKPSKSKNLYEFLLPYGWKKFGRRRPGNFHKWDFYVISPDGTRFRSNVGIHKYLKANPNIECDLDVTNTSFPKNLTEDLNKNTEIVECHDID